MRIQTTNRKSKFKLIIKMCTRENAGHRHVKRSKNLPSIFQHMIFSCSTDGMFKILRTISIFSTEYVNRRWLLGKHLGNHIFHWQVFVINCLLLSTVNMKLHSILENRLAKTKWLTTKYVQRVFTIALFLVFFLPLSFLNFTTGLLVLFLPHFAPPKCSVVQW